jgi:hypothetical protein
VHAPAPGLLAGSLLAWSFLGPAASAQTLQDAIDEASPGDTIRIDPGDYVRPVTVDKAITLVPGTPGTVRLAGISGGAATVVGITFDGTLAAKTVTLASCESGLRFVDCVFQGPGTRGALVRAGAEGVTFEGCGFASLIEAVGLEAGAVSLTLEDTEVTECILALVGPDVPFCDDGPGREPAARCASGCGTITLTGVRFTGGDSHITISGDYTVSITESRFAGPSQWAIAAGGVRLEMESTDCVSEGGAGVGLVLRSVSGYVRQSRIVAWDTALAIDDGGCRRYSDITIGGALEAANDIGSQTLSLDLGQPEPVDAEFNFWGTLICSEALSLIAGQTVSRITDAGHAQTVTCPGTPALPSTWGRIKVRFSPGSGGLRP